MFICFPWSTYRDHPIRSCGTVAQTHGQAHSKPSPHLAVLSSPSSFSLINWFSLRLLLLPLVTSGSQSARSKWGPWQCSSWVAPSSQSREWFWYRSIGSEEHIYSRALCYPSHSIFLSWDSHLHSHSFSVSALCLWYDGCFGFEFYENWLANNLVGFTWHTGSARLHHFGNGTRPISGLIPHGNFRLYISPML